MILVLNPPCIITSNHPFKVGINKKVRILFSSQKLVCVVNRHKTREFIGWKVLILDKTFFLFNLIRLYRRSYSRKTNLQKSMSDNLEQMRKGYTFDLMSRASVNR